MKKKIRLAPYFGFVFIALPIEASQKTNIVINKPNAIDPVVNNQNYGVNTIIGTDSSFSGSGNVLLGTGSTVTSNSTAVGQNTSATNQSTAIGTASVAHDNSLSVGTQSYSENGSIAIGTQSVSTNGQVSVGNQYVQRRIENVASGIAQNDAVNVGQLNDKVKPLKESISSTQTLTKSNQKRIDSNESAINENSLGILHNSNRIDELNSNYQQYVDDKFSQLQGDINNVRRRADAGVASAMAMTSITAPLNDFNYNIGMGIGGYGSQSAAAIGAKVRLNMGTTIGLTTSYDSQRNVGLSAGINWSFN